MKIHTPNLLPAPALALVPADVRHERSARACREALALCPAGVVAHRLRCHEDLVRRWARGQGSPTLTQVLASPERFALSLLAAAGRVYAPPVEVVEVPPAERLRLLTIALAALLGSTGLRDVLEQYSDEELAERDRRYAEIESQAARERAAIRRVREARSRTVDAPAEDKGGR